MVETYNAHWLHKHGRNEKHRWPETHQNEPEILPNHHKEELSLRKVIIIKKSYHKEKAYNDRTTAYNDKPTAYNDRTTAYKNKPTAYNDGTTAYNDKPTTHDKYYHIRQLRCSIDPP